MTYYPTLINPFYSFGTKITDLDILGQSDREEKKTVPGTAFAF